MLTGNDDSLDASYKLIRILVKLMTRAGIVSRFHCLKGYENKTVTHLLVKRVTHRYCLVCYCDLQRQGLFEWMQT